MKKTLILALIILCSISFASITLAEDFTFYVPVKFYNNCDKIKNFQITCHVTTDNLQEVIGSGSTQPLYFPPDNDIVRPVKFNAYAGKNPADATKYKCYVNMTNQSGQGFIFGKYGMEKYACPLQEGRQLITEVTGNIN
ncbi:MAG: hypothetical protein JW737_00940 [Acidobacteria bacterium]|nr:hypothetical protein [Acidobacteriota bacterium]